MSATPAAGRRRGRGEARPAGTPETRATNAGGESGRTPSAPLINTRILRRLPHLHGIFGPAHLLPQPSTFHHSPALTLTAQLPAALSAPLGVWPLTFDYLYGASVRLSPQRCSSCRRLSEVRTSSLLAPLQLHTSAHALARTCRNTQSVVCHSCAEEEEEEEGGLSARACVCVCV